MKKIAWVTDSTASLDEELVNHPDLYTVPMSIILDEEEYKDKIDLTPEELFQRLKSLKNPPKTSQPSVGEFKNLYEKLQGEYEEVISILVSSDLSGTVSSSEQASQLVDIPVTTIDSRILSYPLTVQIKKGMEWLAEGKSVSVIEEKIEKIRETYETYVLVRSLEQLHRSGRMSGMKFFLGSMLNVKPIISVANGVLSIKDKARSEKKAKEKIYSYLQSSYEKFKFEEVYILYGLHITEALKWKDELESEFPSIRFSCHPLGATIGVHAGEDTIGISWYNDLD
ncbi:DegV family protein [Robertmurraya yapensis]|uniref:DegV family protein n=1 Tax=Bacillus yapensis TaxID=2492960 RepID=A0A3S0RL84_9BACI|nr:DegV family protein [Bacillus yapensis]RTR31122.1 DegV family protein [Bacillus yapensis]TKS95551.1 DegV family protein [Bacillus yapensis]